MKEQDSTKKTAFRARHEKTFSEFLKFGRGRRHGWSPAEGKEGKLPDSGLEYERRSEHAKHPCRVRRI